MDIAFNWEKIVSRLKNLKQLVKGDDRISKEINNLEEELAQIGEKNFKAYEICHSELAYLKLKVDDLESQIKQLQLENAEHREKESKIALGQVVWLFERSLAMFVLPENVANQYGEFDAESFMHKWLEENEISDEGKERRMLYNRALALQKVNKKLNIKEAKCQLRWIRNTMAHPSKVDLDDARLEVERYLPSMRDECLHIIETVEKLHSLMKLGRLAREFQNGVYKFVFNVEGNINIQAIQKIVEANKEIESYQRWMHLKGEIVWNNDHDEALAKIQDLKRNERPKLCPLQDVTLDIAQKYVIDFVPGYQRDDVINLIKKLNSLQLGQLATNFQDAFPSYVVPDENLKNVREVEDWLEREKDTQHGKEAIRRRNEITEGMTWTKNHQNALDKMMELKREYDIDTEINVDTAKLYYIDFLPNNLRKSGLNILEMYERLQKVKLHD